LLQTFIA